MAFSLLAHTIANSGGTGTVSTTSAIDTTGATVITLVVNGIGGATPTDNKSNTWTRLAHALNTASCDIWVSINPTVGSGHTFSVTQTAPSIAAAAWSGTGPVADQANTNTGSSVGTLNTGSVTPAVVNELLIAGGLASGTDITAVDSGFTLLDHIAGDGATVFGTALAYEIQTSITARNPTFTFGTSAGTACAAIATLKLTVTDTGKMFLVF